MNRLPVPLLAILALLAAPAGAATITPVAASTTDTVGAGSTGNVIDGTLDFDVYLLMGPLQVGAPFTGPYTVSFELGGLYDLSGMSLWNNGGFIDLDGEGVNAFSLAFRNGVTVVGNYDGAAADLLAQQTFSFAAAGVSAIDLRISSNHAPAERPYAIFYEINFDGVTAVPLPGSVLLLATGLASLVVRAGRRGRTGTAR